LYQRKNMSKIINESKKYQYIKFRLKFKMFKKNVFLNFKLNFLELFQQKFLSFVQFPSSCKISDQTDKIPKNESKNQINSGGNHYRTPYIVVLSQKYCVVHNIWCPCGNFVVSLLKNICKDTTFCGVLEEIFCKIP